jgi:hypothetical protein
MNTKIWGVGLGRTGTRSLQKALELLDYKVIHNPPYLRDIMSVDSGIEGIVISHFKYIDVRFPNSKFILTTRDLDSWLASCKDAINRYPIDRFSPDSEYYEPMIRNRVARFGALHYDKDVLTAKYYQHHHEVVSHFRGKELLIMNIINGDGWGKLCEFLGKEKPCAKFPKILDV